MTEDQFLDSLGQREGLRYSEPPQNDQPTAPYGITLRALTADAGHPCTVTQLRALTAPEAREVARRALRRDVVRFGFAQIADEALKTQLIDFAYNSGPARAIRWLQRAISVPSTGRLDAETLRALAAFGPPANNALALARVEMIRGAVRDGAISAKFERGLVARAQSFLVA